MIASASTRNSAEYFGESATSANACLSSSFDADFAGKTRAAEIANGNNAGSAATIVLASAVTHDFGGFDSFAAAITRSASIFTVGPRLSAVAESATSC